MWFVVTPMGTLSANVTYPHDGDVTGSQDRRSSLINLRYHQPPSVLVMPVWKGQVAVQERDGASGLLGCSSVSGRKFYAGGLTSNSYNPRGLHWTSRHDLRGTIGKCGVLEGWFCNDTRMEGGASVIPYQWRRPEEMAERSEWHRPHFESLRHCGVWARGGHGSIFPSRRGPILQSARYITSLQTTTDPSTLTAVIQAGVITDGFLNGVLEALST